MTLKKYNESIFNRLLKWIKFIFDEETEQYSLINDETPWIFWLWNTKKEAIEEYISSFSDSILINENIKNEIKTFA